MTELRPSFAPRRKINSSFLPFNPMVPSARARFIRIGMSTSVDRATPMPILNERFKNDRRLRMWKGGILLFLEMLQGHQHADHAAHSLVVRGGRRAAHGQAVERRAVGWTIGAAVVQIIHRRAPIKSEVACA